MSIETSQILVNAPDSVCSPFTLTPIYNHGCLLQCEQILNLDRIRGYCPPDAPLISGL